LKIRRNSGQQTDRQTVSLSQLGIVKPKARPSQTSEFISRSTSCLMRWLGREFHLCKGSGVPTLKAYCGVWASLAGRHTLSTEQGLRALFHRTSMCLITPEQHR